MSDELFLFPRDERLDPLSLESVGAWAARMKPGHRSRKKARAVARSLAALVHRMWPGIDEVAGERELTLRALDPDAPLCVVVAEDRARVSMPREPREGEPSFVRRVSTAISRQTGWLAYDPRRGDIVAGAQWRCAECGHAFALQDLRCPRCMARPSREALAWTEPQPLFPSTQRTGVIELAPLLWHYELGRDDLGEAVVSQLQTQLGRALSDSLDGDTPLEVMVEAESAILEVFQCVQVVEAVSDPAREVPLGDLPEMFEGTEVGDELLFALHIAHDDQGAGARDDEAYGDLLPLRSRQPGLARPIWAALRPILEALRRAPVR